MPGALGAEQDEEEAEGHEEPLQEPLQDSPQEEPRPHNEAAAEDATVQMVKGLAPAGTQAVPGGRLLLGPLTLEGRDRWANLGK